MINKKGAMEMTVGTIVTIVLLMSALVLGLILTRSIFKSSTENIDSIDNQVKSQITDLFGSSDEKLVIMLGDKTTATVKQGTANFGVAMGFAPTNPKLWGTNKEGCKYNVEAVQQNTYCIKKGWANIQNSIITGTSNVVFDNVDSTNGYTVIKISVPEDLAPCLQAFRVTVKCAGDTSETTTKTFYFDVIKKGLR